MFKKAVPIFLKDKDKEVNYHAGFICYINTDKCKKATLNITAATLYKVYLNGVFLAYGPARAPHGYVRSDTIEFNLNAGLNTIFVEVAGYNISSFYTLKHDSFLLCEIETEQGEYYYTGRDFKGVDLSKVRKQNVTRYSYQRTFAEVYLMDRNIWEYTPDAEIEEVVLNEEILQRGVPNPLYKLYCNVKPYDEGEYERIDGFTDYNKRFLLNYNECEDRLLDELYIKQKSCKISEYVSGTYKEFVFDNNNTGFINITVKALEDSEIYLYFSETLDNGKINCGLDRSQTINIVKYSLKKSNEKYKLETFEVYGLKYLGILVKSGNIDIEKVFLREYSYPLFENTKVLTDDDELNIIFKSAVNSFRTCLLDIYMDCPTRERAGWLCDSFFEGRSETYFAGNSMCNKVFLENFVIAKELKTNTQGLLPMCYPSNTEEVIPQWNLWYILQVYEYLKKNDCNKEFFRYRIEQILKHFEENENEFGLYEITGKWMFIEWSMANDYTDGVNYPTNMLYYKTLKAASEILDNPELDKKAERIKRTIIEQSFNGMFFADNSVKVNNIYERTNNISETCQYYAFYFGIANDEEYSELKNILIDKFGPSRKKNGNYPDIEYSTPFIGYLLRLMLLQKWGKNNQVLEEIKEYYLYMAKETGTLWEFKHSDHSCNHGINSYIGIILAESLCGICNLDHKNKIVQFNNTFAGGIKYNVEIGLGDGNLNIRSDGVNRIIKNTSSYNVKSESLLK